MKINTPLKKMHTSTGLREIIPDADLLLPKP